MKFEPDLTSETGRDWQRRISAARAEKPKAVPSEAPKRAAAHITGRMNQTEAAFARRLDGLKADGQVLAWWFEPFKVRLDDPETGRCCWYTVDFLVVEPSGERVHAEVKGRQVWEDSVIKWKWAAHEFAAWGRWEMWQRVDGEFTRIRVAGGGGARPP